MKGIWILLFLSFLGLGHIQSQESTSTFIIELISDEIQEVSFSQLDFESGKMKAIKTIKELSTKKPNEVIFPFSEPAIYSLTFNTGTKLKIAVENPGAIQLRMEEPVELTSGISNLVNFDQQIQQLNARFFGNMIQEYDKALAENDQKKIDELEVKKEELLVEFIAAMEDIVRNMRPTALAYDALGYFDLYKNHDFYVEMNKKFQATHPQATMSQALQKTLDQVSKLNVGNKAPVFSAKDVNQSNISLDSYKGSYVLLDFWASWCRACRVENPKFAEIYKTHRNKNFEILSISIDSDVKAWKQAIKQDAMLWKQILDTDNKLFQLYFLSSLPANFLLDKEGKIIARNLTAAQLIEHLEQF